MPQGIGMEGTMNQIDTMSVNAIRVLAADAVQKAKSGHPRSEEHTSELQSQR